MNNSNWTGRTARTTDQALGCSGFAGYAYHQPAYKRALYGLVRHGWMVAVAILAVLVLSGCVDMESEQLSAASLRDAIAQAQKDRPELWTAEHKKRADVAAGIVAKGVQP